MKNPETYQIMRFSSIKSQNHNLLKKSIILVFLCYAEHLFSIKTLACHFRPIVNKLICIWWGACSSPGKSIIFLCHAEHLFSVKTVLKLFCFIVHCRASASYCTPVNSGSVNNWRLLRP